MKRNARKRLAQKLRLLRFLNDWSQEDLAGASGLDRSYVSSIERAERNVSLDNVEKLADAFGITFDEFLCPPDATEFGEQLLEKLTKPKKRKR